MSPPIREGSGNDIGSIRLGDGSEIAEVRTGAGDVLFSAIPDSALTQDLVAWYRFEDGDARDYTATLNATFADTTAYDGTVDGATFQSSTGVTDFENGANSGAFDFDGSNDEINFNNSPNLIGEGTHTMWLKAPQTSSRRAWFSDGGYTGDGYGYQMKSDTNSSLRIFAFGTTSIDFTTELFTDSWVHLAIVYTTNEIQAFVNGVSDGVESNPDILRDNNFEYDFGYRTDTNSQYYHGQMDDFRVYNRALTSTEISDIYNATEP